MRRAALRRIAAGVAAGAVAALAVGVAAPPGAHAATEERPGTLRTSDRPDGRPLDVVRIDGVDYVDLQELALLFRATKYWRPEIGKMVLKVGERRVTITVGSPFVQVEQQGANLLAPVVWHRGRIFVPVRLATRVLDPLVPESVRWIPEPPELRVVRGDPNVLGLSWDLRGGVTLVSIRLAEPLPGRIEREGDRAIVRVPGGRLAETVPPRTRGIGLVESVEVEEVPGTVTLTFHLGSADADADLVERRVPPRLDLVVEESAEARGELPEPAFAPPDDLAAPRPVRLVVLDPGHGGSDEGASSPGGLSEKEVTLAIARRARDLLVADGFDVVLTRDEDRFVSPEARARVANGRGADAFVSLHANAWFDDGLEGFSVGVSSAPARPPANPRDPRPWGARDTTAARDAETLAEILSGRLGEATRRPNHGVRADAWAPLAGVSAPAVLVECGFLTNGGDAKRLGDASYRDRVATAIAAALREYRDALAGAGAATREDTAGEESP